MWSVVAVALWLLATLVMFVSLWPMFWSFAVILVICIAMEQEISDDEDFAFCGDYSSDEQGSSDDDAPLRKKAVSKVEFLTILSNLCSPLFMSKQF